LNQHPIDAVILVQSIYLGEQAALGDAGRQTSVECGNPRIGASLAFGSDIYLARPVFPDQNGGETRRAPNLTTQMRRDHGCALPQPGSDRSPVDDRCVRHSDLLLGRPFGLPTLLNGGDWCKKRKNLSSASALMTAGVGFAVLARFDNPDIALRMGPAHSSGAPAAGLRPFADFVVIRRDLCLGHVHLRR
jgi:hypothetical protein